MLFCVVWPLSCNVPSGGVPIIVVWCCFGIQQGGCHSQQLFVSGGKLGL